MNAYALVHKLLDEVLDIPGYGDEGQPDEFKAPRKRTAEVTIAFTYPSADWIERYKTMIHGAYPVEVMDIKDVKPVEWEDKRPRVEATAVVRGTEEDILDYAEGFDVRWIS